MALRILAERLEFGKSGPIPACLSDTFHHHRRLRLYVHAYELADSERRKRNVAHDTTVRRSNVGRVPTVASRACAQPMVASAQRKGQTCSRARYPRENPT